MRKFILSLLLLAFGFSVSACVPQFSETIKVQVSGTDGYVIPGVEVWATYQESSSKGVFINGSFVPIYAETKHLYTDERGEVTLSVVNKERDPDKLDCKVTIHTKYFGIEEKHVLDLNSKPPIFRVKLDAKRVKVSVTSEGKPIDAEVFFENFGNISVANGVAYISLPIGYEVRGYVLLREEGVKHYFKEMITPDYELLLVGLRKKPVTVKVMNEQGVPLPFTINISGNLYNAPEGELELKLFEGSYTAIIEVEGNTLLEELDTSSKEATVVLDLNAPEIISLDIGRVSDTEAVMTFRVVDRGSRASGVSSIKLFIDRQEVPLNFDGTQYSAQFKLEKTAPFKIELKDKRGNTRIIEGTIKYTPPSVSVEEPSQEETGEQKEGGGINIISLIVGFIALLIVAGILYVIKVMYF